MRLFEKRHGYHEVARACELRAVPPARALLAGDRHGVTGPQGVLQPLEARGREVGLADHAVEHRRPLRVDASASRHGGLSVPCEPTQELHAERPPCRVGRRRDRRELRRGLGRDDLKPSGWGHSLICGAVLRPGQRANYHDDKQERSSYAYRRPHGGVPFRVRTAVAVCAAPALQGQGAATGKRRVTRGVLSIRHKLSKWPPQRHTQ
mmetsp:Transcript_22966/g.71248  ORF Transcript_22966/g.71248 Transcript_22966/m.71248 type:complete len:207 (+) Transcript_22966:127-747(+)